MTKEYTYVASIGFFDGVHIGHRFLIEQVKEEAVRRGMQSMVVTFPVHPRKVLQADYQPCLLTTNEEKLTLLGDTGIDRIVSLDFTKDMAEMSACDFMALLHREHGVGVLVVGYDHRFGHGRAEGFEEYVSYGQRLGMDVVRARELPGGASSTAVRRALERGDVRTANKTLGYSYFLQGAVVHGFGNGARLGYPTANLRTDGEKQIPANGVYYAHVSGEALGSGRWAGALNIGVRPTLENGTERSIEVFILGFQGDLYGERIRIDILDFLRTERKFDSVEALREQLMEDERACKERMIMEQN